MALRVRASQGQDAQRGAAGRAAHSCSWRYFGACTRARTHTPRRARTQHEKRVTAHPDNACGVAPCVCVLRRCELALSCLHHVSAFPAFAERAQRRLRARTSERAARPSRGSQGKGDQKPRGRGRATHCCHVFGGDGRQQLPRPLHTTVSLYRCQCTFRIVRGHGPALMHDSTANDSRHTMLSQLASCMHHALYVPASANATDLAHLLVITV